jgi:hypothetical protein
MNKPLLRALHPTTAFLALALLSLATTGCGDLTSATGELGRVNYTLHTNYLVQEAMLTQVGIITGHQQHIGTRLTDSGEDRAGDDGEEITHSVSPSEGVTLEAQESGDDEIADIYVTVDDPGGYTFESHLNGELFDRINLVFETPVELELLTRVRVPYSDDWDTLNDGETLVEEGSQVAFLPIPLNDVGDRIAGDFDVLLEADPEWAVAPAYNLIGVYEQNIVGSASPVSIYFIEPGEVTVTLTDTVNGTSASWLFDVLPVDQT